MRGRAADAGVAKDVRAHGRASSDCMQCGGVQGETKNVMRLRKPGAMRAGCEAGQVGGATTRGETCKKACEEEDADEDNDGLMRRRKTAVGFAVDAQVVVDGQISEEVVEEASSPQQTPPLQEESDRKR